MTAIREFSVLCLLLNKDYLKTFEEIKSKSDAIKSNNAPIRGEHKQDIKEKLNISRLKPI